MWLPSSEPLKVLNGGLKKSDLSLTGYLKILNGGDELIVFIRDKNVIAAWKLHIDTLEEHYEYKALENLEINSESRIEFHELDNNTFKAILELNEECKLSLPADANILVDCCAIKNRDEILSKYRIIDPSEQDVDRLINDYKSEKGG